MDDFATVLFSLDAFAKVEWTHFLVHCLQANIHIILSILDKPFYYKKYILKDCRNV